MSDFIRGLLEKFLGWAQDNLYRKPSRSWNEIDGIDRFGRIALMAILSALLVVPLGWFLFR